MQTKATAGEVPSQWPMDAILSEEAFENPLRLYYHQVVDLALTILEILARNLPYGSHIFDRFVEGDQIIASLRLLHSPSQASTDERQLGIGAHANFGAITLLLQDKNPGLQVLDLSTNQWSPAPPNKDAYVINIGNMLAMWTKGLYKSGLHRVINRSLKDRYSMPFFFDGAPGCPLLPFDGSRPEGRILTVKDHMEIRIASAYKRGLNNQRECTF